MGGPPPLLDRRFVIVTELLLPPVDEHSNYSKDLETATVSSNAEWRWLIEKQIQQLIELDHFS